MSLSSLLLRCVLLVSLVASGAGIAQASVRMDLAHAVHSLDRSPPAASAAPTGTSDCHVQAGASGVDAGGSDDGEGVTGARGDNTVDASDCCDGAGCDCACVQHASAAAGAELEIIGLAVSTTGRVIGLVQHASPLLPHLIRPPIG